MPRLAAPLRTIRIAFLACGELPQTLIANHGDILTIYHQWLKAALPRHSGTRLVLHRYDAANMKYPRESQLPRYDAVMLTGSPANAWADEPWINGLVSFVRHVVDNHPKIKIYGICFGHQIVGRALGGIAQQNAKGWELGSTTVYTTDVGKILFGVDRIDLQQLHQDHVPLSSFSSSSSSGEIHSLGYTDNTDNHGLVKFHSQTFNPVKSSDYSNCHLSRKVHVMTIQGHPEFTGPLTTDIAKEVHGMDPSDTTRRDQQESRAGMEAGVNKVVVEVAKNDGVNVVGKAIWRMFGIRGGNIRQMKFLSF